MNALPIPRLWLVRHARPLVAPGICYGRLDMQADAQATADAAQDGFTPHGVIRV